MFRKRLVVFSNIMLFTLLAACTPVVTSLPADRDLLYQTSTLSTLSAGDFEGDLTIGALKTHGNFGLGTYNALDGEMVVLDGVVYQIRDTGVPYIAADDSQTPFAAVTYFDADQTLVFSDTLDCPQLQEQIDSQLPTLDQPYAIKISGEFASLKLRAPHRQSQPYPTLTDALADQVVFESQNISGTMAGFRLPPYMEGDNSPGYHFHFISDDKQHGGHVLDCQSGAVTVRIDTTDHIYMDVTPSSGK